MVDSSAFLEKVLESACIFFLLRLSRLVIKKYTVHGPHHLLIEQVTKLDRKNRRRDVNISVEASIYLGGFWMAMTPKSLSKMGFKAYIFSLTHGRSHASISLLIRFPFLFEFPSALIVNPRLTYSMNQIPPHRISCRSLALPSPFALHVFHCRHNSSGHFVLKLSAATQPIFCTYTLHQCMASLLICH